MLVQNQAALERGPTFAMIGALLIEERRNPALFELFRERIMRPRRDEAVAALQRGVERGEIRVEVDLDIAVRALVGSMFARRILGEPESRETIKQTVDTLWGGLATRPDNQRPALWT
jgi:hypothetical protein